MSEETLTWKSNADRLAKALEALVTEIRAYSSPECDEEGNIGAAELKEADEALKQYKHSVMYGG